MTFVLVTKASKKDDVALDWVPCIYYLIRFKKNEVQALINSGNEINMITLVYILKLGLKVCCINVGA